jgi:hypothetical protein
VETDIGLTPMEDNLNTEETFAPSIFAQAKAITEEFGTPSDKPESKPVYDIQLDEETAQILVEIPFDAMASLTKVNDVCLNEKESRKLAKLWRGPLERLLRQYENSDIAIAALATLAIAGEKYAEYKLEIERRNSTGDAGERENQLRQRQVA